MDACGVEAFTPTVRFTYMVEDGGTTHEGTQIEDKPPAAEGEETSKAAVKRAVSRTQGVEPHLAGKLKGSVAHISGNLGREGPQVPRKLGGRSSLTQTG